MKSGSGVMYISGGLDFVSQGLGTIEGLQLGEQLKILFWKNYSDKETFVRRKFKRWVTGSICFA